MSASDLPPVSPPAEAPDTVLPPPVSAIGPLREPVFRMLWLAWLAANVTMWMNDVAAAWLMTSLTDSVVMVAMVQAASTLPVFVLGLPSGALADIIDRRRYFAVTQLWVALVAVGEKNVRRIGRADGTPRTTNAVPPGFAVVARNRTFVAAVRCP